MNIYDRIIENPLFFKWIFHSSPEINAYWNHYLETNPDQAEKITELKAQIETHLKYEEKKLTEPEKRELAKRILWMLEQTDRKQGRKKFIRSAMRYAAVAFLFFTIGSSLVYLYMESRQPQIFVENSVMPAHAQGPVLLIGNEQPVQLKEGQSELDYSGKNEIVVDREKTIIKKWESKTPEMNTLAIPYGHCSVITLADSSRVWLNAGSRLVYPSAFVDKRREVLLVGEAYFEIHKNEKQPFIVKTADVEIKVLGTHFNVSAYPEDYSVQTVLAKGSVEIGRLNAGMFVKGLILKPGQMGYFNKKNQETRIFDVDVEHYSSWTRGLFSFSNTDLNRIIKRLERYYNMHFQFDDPMKGTIQITGKLDVTKDKLEVFEYLEKLTGLEFVKLNEYQYAIK